MAQTLFRRACRLIVAAPIAEDFATVSARVTEIKDLRVSFKVEKTLSKDPNDATISVYNLNSTTRANLPGKGAKLILEAGYSETVARIFVGDARNILSKREGPDWVTTFECGDGARASSFARVSGSFAAGAKMASVLETIGAATKLPLGNLAEIARGDLGGVTLPGGFVAHGSALRELDKILVSLGYELSIQDEILQVTKAGQPTTEPVFNLNPRTGLIGSPELNDGNGKDKKSTLRITCLLQPQLKPGRKVRLESESFKGEFRISTVEHKGDTNGAEWYSVLELERF